MIKCQMCSTLNKDNSLACVKCGAKLSAPGAAPSVASGPGAGKVDKPAASAPSPSKSQPPSGGTDWLNGLRSSLASEPPADENMPDWLRGDQFAPSEPEPPAFDLAARLGEENPPQAGSPDWLEQLASMPTSPASSPAGPAESDVPDWLKQLGPASPSAVVPHAKSEAAPIPPEADVPDWLKQLTSPPAAQAVPAESDVPDWLRQPPPAPTAGEPPVLAKAQVPDWLEQPRPEPAVSEPPVLPEAELPDWLKQLEPAPEPIVPAAPAAESPAVAEPEPTEAELPDWLKRSTSAPSVAPAPAQPEAELPDWLKQLQPTPGAGVEAAPVPTEPVQEPSAFAVEPELPPWMREQAPPTAEPAFVQEPVALQPEAGGTLPDWLKEIESVPAQPAPVSQTAALVGEQVPQPAGELPDWLKELGPSAAPTEPSPALAGMPMPPPEAGGLVAAQIPAWLQSMRPEELAPQEPEKKQEPAETEGILAGLAGVLQAAEIVKQQTVGQARPLRAEISAPDLARAGVLQELLARGAASIVRRETESRAQKLWNNTQRLIVFLIVLAAVLFPLVQEQLGLNLGLVSAPPLTLAASAVYDAVDKLKPDSLVLVAFDYDATQSAEMDVQASLLLRHLAMRQARVQVVSLYPSGPAVAQTLIERLKQTITGTAQLNAENLGYAPGQDMGVVFSQGYIVSSTLVIELAATPDTVRWWAEQMTAQASDKPLLAGVSAAAEPMSLPYYYSKRRNEMRQVTGMVVGVPGATAYQLKLDALSGNQDRAPILAPVASISLANAVLAVLMVIGALIQSVAGGGKRR